MNKIVKISSDARVKRGQAADGEVVEFEFDRLPRESVKAFTSFRAYLEMGADRSLRKVAGLLKRSPADFAR